MPILTSLLAGLVFGLGLILSGMADPAKVLGFLDLAGRWDPSLALVMAGAIGVGFFAFAVARTRTWSFLGAEMKLPTARHIDRRLVVGCLLFGIGWGVAGISGVLGGLLKPVRGDIGWRVAFVSGLLGAPLLYVLLAGVPRPQIDAGYAALVLAGLLVGVGTRYGSGCTSGHGVCGLSRLSPRSLAATAAFMGAGFLTVYVIRHLFGI